MLPSLHNLSIGVKPGKILDRREQGEDFVAGLVLCKPIVKIKRVRGSISQARPLGR